MAVDYRFNELRCGGKKLYRVYMFINLKISIGYQSDMQGSKLTAL